MTSTEDACLHRCHKTQNVNGVGVYLFLLCPHTHTLLQVAADNWKYRIREQGTNLGNLVGRDCRSPSGHTSREIATTLLLLSVRVTADSETGMIHSISFPVLFY